MERAYLLGTIASVCGTGSMDLLVDNPLWPTVFCAILAILLIRQMLQRIDGFVELPSDSTTQGPRSR